MNSILRDLMTLFYGGKPSDFTDKEVTGFKIIFFLVIAGTALITYSKKFN